MGGSEDNSLREVDIHGPNSSTKSCVDTCDHCCGSSLVVRGDCSSAFSSRNLSSGLGEPPSPFVVSLLRVNPFTTQISFGETHGTTFNESRGRRNPCGNDVPIATAVAKNPVRNVAAGAQTINMEAEDQTVESVEVQEEARMTAKPVTGKANGERTVRMASCTTQNKKERVCV